MSYELKGVRVAFVVANEGIEEVELLRPWRAVVDAGGTPEVVAPRPGMVETMRHLDRARRFPVDQVTERALAADYDAAILPGGVANPDQLRTDAAAVDFLMALTEAGKPVAAICHGPVDPHRGGPRGRGGRSPPGPACRPTCATPAPTGSTAQVVVCRNGINTLVTSRKPEDLNAFCRQLTDTFAPAESPATV